MGGNGDASSLFIYVNRYIFNELAAGDKVLSNAAEFDAAFP